MLFFKTNMGENGTTRLQYYLQFAHSVETLTERRFCRQRKKKEKTTTKRTCKHPEADQTDREPYRVKKRWVGGLQPVCRSEQKGSNNGTNSAEWDNEGTEWKSHDGK